MNNPKYFLYARKSTEDEERQVMSTEAQLAELTEFAKRENLEIVEKFIESKSAKKPGLSRLCGITLHFPTYDKQLSYCAHSFAKLIRGAGN